MPPDAHSDPLDSFEETVRARLGSDADEWLEGVPDLIGSVKAQWDLAVTGTARNIDAFGMTIPALRGETQVEIRISYPDAWFTDEVTALEAWGGTGAVRLLETDPRGASLRVAPDPGTSLAAEPNRMRALRLAADALRSLWIPGPKSLQTVATEVRAWLGDMQARWESAHQPFEQSLLRDAEQLFRSFVGTQTESVLLHGDARLSAFVLDGERAIATDPRPLVGEKAFDIGALLRDEPADLMEDPSAGSHLLQARLDQLTDLLDVSPSRVKGWAFAVAIDLALVAYEGGNPSGGDLLVDVGKLCQNLTA